jgi:hypothetical protein
MVAAILSISHYSYISISLILSTWYQSLPSVPLLNGLSNNQTNYIVVSHMTTPIIPPLFSITLMVFFFGESLSVLVEHVVGAVSLPLIHCCYVFL